MMYDATSEQLFENLSHFAIRYPALIYHTLRTNLTLEIVFFIEDIALECCQSLLDSGITAICRMNNPRVVSLQLPSLIAQEQSSQVIEILDGFLMNVNNKLPNP